MKNIFFWLVLLTCSYAHAQTITIIDTDTEEAIEGVSISSDSSDVFITTNAKGQADISALGKYHSVIIQTMGYQAVIINQDELQKLNFLISLKPTSIYLDGLVISATRWKQLSGDVPSKIVSVSQKDVAIQNPQTAADLLGASGNVYIQKSQQGGGSPMIRGFATNRLLYTIDGVRMNTAIFRGGNLQNVISLDPLAMENTEVLFGPGSVIYGSDAIGGVMSFQTLVPELAIDDKPMITGKALRRYSSANQEKTGHFDIGVGWKKWALLTSISSNDYSDLKMGSNGPDDYLSPHYVQRVDSLDQIFSNNDPEVQAPSGYSQLNMMQKVRFRPNKKWDIRYGFHFSETSDYARYDRHIRYKNGLPRYGEWSYGPQVWMMNNLSITNSTESKMFNEVSLNLAHQRFEESRMSRNLNDNLREVRSEKVAAYSANLDFVKKINKKNKLFYGLETVWNDVESIGENQNISTGENEVGPSRYPQSLWSSYGVYATHQYKQSEKLMIQSGLRYNQYILESEFDTSFYDLPFTNASLNKGALTGSAGLVYRPSNKWIISSNLATAFRSPNVDDVGKVFDSEPGSVVVPNPDLNAEYAYNADINVAKIFSNKVKIDFSAFYTQLKNALVRRDYSLNGADSIYYDGELSKVQAIQNAAKANVYGFQAGIEWKLPKGFSLSSDFNFQKGTEELDNGTTSASRHAAPWFGNTRLTYAVQRLNMQLYTVYCGSKSYKDLPVSEQGKDYLYALDEDGNPYSPSWYTLNFKAMYQFAEHFSVSTGIENITDQRYRPYSSGLAGAGRNFVFALRYKF
jgi:hemoglobin/transferrin/lactoferrin receptor protein